MSDTRPDPGGTDRPDPIVAAEYVLHLLEPEERREVEARLETSGLLRALVAEWSEYFVRLAEDIAAIDPPARIRERLAAIATSRAPPPSRDRAASRGIGFGRLVKGLIGGVVVAAAALVLMVVLGPQVQPPYSGPIYTAEVAAEDASLVIQARLDPRDGTLTLDRAQGSARPDRVLQLWLIDDGADAPVSLGVLPETREARVELPEALARRVETGVLAVSDEPPGGSTTGAPTGDVLATGEVGEI